MKITRKILAAALAALLALAPLFIFPAAAETEGAVLLGDVDGDGQINTTDARLIAGYVVGQFTENDLNLSAADVNGDGVVSVYDVLLVLRFSCSCIDSFPVEGGGGSTDSAGGGQSDASVTFSIGSPIITQYPDGAMAYIPINATASAVAACTLELSYNPSVMTFDGSVYYNINYGSYGDYNSSQNSLWMAHGFSDKVRLCFIPTSPKDGNPAGTVAYLPFRLAAGASFSSDPNISNFNIQVQECRDFAGDFIHIVKLKGDVNGDGKIDTVDARLVLQNIIGKLTFVNMNCFDVADVNGDGKVDTVDARLILQYIVGKITSFD